MEIGFNEKEASAYMGDRYGRHSAPKHTTLSKLRCIGGGPIFRKVGKRVVYYARDLDAWMQSRLSLPVPSTSALEAAHAE